jgi:hypothetical protein
MIVPWVFRLWRVARFLCVFLRASGALRLMSRSERCDSMPLVPLVANSGHAITAISHIS